MYNSMDYTCATHNESTFMGIKMKLYTIPILMISKSPHSCSIHLEMAVKSQVLSENSQVYGSISYKLRDM